MMMIMIIINCFLARDELGMCRKSLVSPIIPALNANPKRQHQSARKSAVEQYLRPQMSVAKPILKFLKSTAEPCSQPRACRYQSNSIGIFIY